MDSVENIEKKKSSPEAERLAEEKAAEWSEAMEGVPFAGEDIDETGEGANEFAEQDTESLADIREKLNVAYEEEKGVESKAKPATPRVAKLYDYLNEHRKISGENEAKADGESEKFNGVDIPKDFLEEDLEQPQERKVKKINFFEKLRKNRELKNFTASDNSEETFSRIDKLSLAEQEKIYASEHVYELANLAVAAAKDNDYHKPALNSLPHLYKIVAGMEARQNDPSTPEAEKAKLKELLGDAKEPDMMIENLLEGKNNSLEVTELLVKKDKDYNYGAEFIRNDIADYAFGDNLTNIGKDLISLGVIKLDKNVRQNNVVFGADSYLYPREYDGKPIEINTDTLQKMNCSEEEIGRMREAVDLMNCEWSELTQKLEGFKEEKTDDALMLKDTLERLKGEALERAGKNFKEAMKQDLEKAKKLDEVEYEDKKIDVLGFSDGDEFKMLVHRLGAYSEKDNNDPAQWNEREADTKDADGNPIGYVSTSTLTDKNFHLAVDKTEMSNPDEVFYAFSDFKDDTIKAMSEYDLYTEDDASKNENMTTMRQGVIYTDFDEFVKQGEDWHKSYNNLNHDEVVLDRYNGDKDKYGGRIQPNYVIAFQKDLSDISETTKKHAAYFGVPIIVIDPNKYQ